MDDELQKLETELKRLRPAAPSRELTGRLEGQLAPRRSYSFFWLGLPAGAVAAVLGLAAVLTFRHRASTQPPAAVPALARIAPALKPVAADDVLVDVQDEGYMMLADGTQVRRTRQSYVDTITWKDPANHASLRWSVPRQEVSVQPVSFQ